MGISLFLIGTILLKINRIINRTNNRILLNINRNLSYWVVIGGICYNQSKRKGGHLLAIPWRTHYPLIEPFADGIHGWWCDST